MSEENSNLKLGSLAFLKLDLGIRELIPEWKLIFSKKYIKEDLIAGLIVASLGLPLSLALALASGVEPVTGVITAVVAGIVCALFGGTPLSISGPSNAMPVVLAAVAQQFGLSGLLLVGIGCGVLQILTGLFRLGRIIRYIPFPVVAGFTAGIGGIILISQLPRALGLPAPDESHIIDVITHIHGLILETNIVALSLAVGTVSINFLLPRYLPKLPAPLISVIIPTLIIYFLGIPTPTIGPLTYSLDFHHFSHLPTADIQDLISVILAVYTIASLETLLSTTSAESLSRDYYSDPDQELIGQGIGNIFTSILGGIPGTSVIARTALNIQVGAKTRRAAIFQSLVILIATFLFLSSISQIPIAVLVGVTLSIALRMLHPREFFRLWKLSRIEATIYLVTFLAILFFDLFAGIRTGLVVALIIAAIRLNRSQTQLKLLNTPQFQELSIDGPLTFLTTGNIESFHTKLTEKDSTQGLVVNCSKVDSIDATGASQLIQFLEPLIEKRKVVLLGLKPECKKILLSLDQGKSIAKTIVSSESEMMNVLFHRSGSSPLNRLMYGVEKFKQDITSNYGSLFKKLAENQSPHTLFITCSDSRIDPNLITSTHPGELFIVRNVGNLIPPYGTDATPAEGAAVEFAVGVLNVKEIVVCGHSGCGAMKEILQEGLLKSENAKNFPSLMSWLSPSRSLKEQLPPRATLQQCSEINAVQQLENLKTYPLIHERLKKKEIRLHAWYYNIGESELEEWDESKSIFVTIGSKDTRSLEKRMEAGIQFQAPILPKK